jgi:adenosylcobinamide kinase/adenosylcobinamide-phosphate guanylyltransferase
MQERVKKHQQERGGQQWDTIEETTALRGVLNDADKYQVLLVDCLTLWVSNLLYEAEQQGCRLAEEKIECLCRDILATCLDRSGTVILVTNEVGMGIVPENEVARRFRDLAGRCNQDMAAGADEVILIACGIPLHLKGVE